MVLQEEIPDVERNGYCFSDGVGCISPGDAHVLDPQPYPAAPSMPSSTEPAYTL
jgi:hypothetical protein